MKGTNNRRQEVDKKVQVERQKIGGEMGDERKAIEDGKKMGSRQTDRRQKAGRWRQMGDEKEVTEDGEIAKAGMQ